MQLPPLSLKTKEDCLLRRPPLPLMSSFRPSLHNNDPRRTDRDGSRSKSGSGSVRVDRTECSTPPTTTRRTADRILVAFSFSSYNFVSFLCAITTFSCSDGKGPTSGCRHCTTPYRTVNSFLCNYPTIPHILHKIKLGSGCGMTLNLMLYRGIDYILK